mgnify:CR=1 FL=1
MKLYEMMDRTPLPGDQQLKDHKSYLDYMKMHRPDHFNGLVQYIANTQGKENVNLLMSAINLGADMALLQVLQHGMPEDLPGVYGKAAGPLLWRP